MSPIKDNDTVSNNNKNVSPSADIISPNAPSNQNGSKKKKGRLKKLLKKCSTITLSSKNKNNKNKEALTGIVTRSDAIELQQLILTSKKDKQQKILVGPSIHTIHSCDRSNDNKGWQQTAGDHHRQLIQFLLFHSSSSTNNCSNQFNDKTKNRKRKRKTEDTENETDTSNHKNASQYSSLSPPSWARIHNLALLNGVAVVEFAIDDDKDEFQMPSSRLASTENSINDTTSKHVKDVDFISHLLRSRHDDCSEELEKNKKRACLPVFVDLFQGDRPRHITDVIMYDLPPRQTDNNIQITNKDCSNKSKYQILVDQLLTLCATPSDLRNNLFPIPSQDNQTTSDNSKFKNTKMNGFNNDDNSLRRELYNMASTHFDNQQKNSANKDWKYNTHSLFDTHTETNDHYDPSVVHENNEFLTSFKKINYNNYDASLLISHFSVPIDSTTFRSKDWSPKVNSMQENKKDNNNIHSAIPPKYFVETCFSNLDFFDNTKPSSSDGRYDHSMVTNNTTVLDGKSFPQTRIFALDCEMVKTSDGIELARVTLVQYCHNVDEKEDGSLNYRYRVVLDALVKPHLDVLDYVTTYSGITATMLESVTTRIEDVQATLLLTVYKEDIIIGHSLDNDMRALRWIHPLIVDTSLIFPHENSWEGKKFSKKYSLRHLSAILLKKPIQRQHSQKQGHCSVEDAAASLYLALRKANLGPSFGIKRKRNNRLNIFQKVNKRQKYLRKRQQDSLLLSSSDSCGNNNNDTGDDLISRNFQRPLVCLGPTEWINDHILSFQNVAHALSCESIFSSSVKALYSWLKHKCDNNSRQPFFLWSKLCFCSNEIGIESHKNINDKIDDIMSNVLEKVAPDTLVLFIFQRGYKRAKSLYKQRMAAKNYKSTLGWSQKQENEYMKVLSIPRQSEAIWFGANLSSTN